MRDIKFRAWDKVNNKWAVIDLDDWAGSVGPSATISYGDIPGLQLDNYDPYVWLQYTGLKDKNGVEIYEGDIVRIGTLDNEPLGAIEWSDEWAQYNLKDNEKYQFGREHVSYLHTPYFEVVGNIYETPDLLK